MCTHTQLGSFQAVPHSGKLCSKAYLATCNLFFFLEHWTYKGFLWTCYILYFSLEERNITQVEPWTAVALHIFAGTCLHLSQIIACYMKTIMIYAKRGTLAAVPLPGPAISVWYHNPEVWSILYGTGHSKGHWFRCIEHLLCSLG